MSSPVAQARLRLPPKRVAQTSAWLQPLGLIGLSLGGAWLLAAALAPWVAPHDPLGQDFQRFLPPSSSHLFGTDQLGRDMLSRTLWGARLSIPVAVLLVCAALVVGGALGGFSGYFGGWADELVMRATDLVFAFPAIILAMAVTGSLGPGLAHTMLAIVLVSWPQYARVARGLVRSAMLADYVAAARLLGASPVRALAVDVLPNVAGPLLVLATLDVGNVILLLSGLSFLGLGAQPPTPEWGSMVGAGTQYFQYWWIGTFPGLAILTVVLALNFLGDSLRDALDPLRATGAGLSRP